MRIGIISDIHEDFKNLNKAILLLEKMNADELVCLGDIVGFNTKSFNYLERRNPAKCIAAVRENCSIVVTGNHDLFAIRKTPQHQAGFIFSDDWYTLDFDTRNQKGGNYVWLYEETELSAMLSKKDRIYLASLPETATMEIPDQKLFFSHYLYPDVSGSGSSFTHLTNETSLHFKNMTSNGCSISFSGHGHIGGIISINQKEIIESGFSPITLNTFPHAFVGPAIAQGERQNGLMVFDSNEKVLECISLT